MPKKHLYFSYYSFLIVAVLGSVVWTILSGSRYVAFGSTLARLEKQHANLLHQQSYLHQQLAQTTSLKQADRFAEQGSYQPITSPLLLTLPNTLASR